MEALIDGKRLASVLTAGVVVLSLGLGLSGCKKPVVSEEPPAETTPAPTATPSPTPAVAAATPAATPVTPAPQLAPPGVFYLLAAARVETNDGIVGLPPGTGVKLVKPGVYLTPAGEVPLDPNQLTNDMALARRARDQDKMTQTALQQRQAIAARTAAAQAAASAGSSNNSSSPGATTQDEKMAARQEISRQLEANQQQINDLTSTLSQVSAKYGTWESAAKKSPQAFQLTQQLSALQSEREALVAKMAQIQ